MFCSLALNSFKRNFKFPHLKSQFAPIRGHNSSAKKGPLTITYITPEKETITLKVAENSNLLDIAHANDIELEGMGLETLETEK